MLGPIAAINISFAKAFNISGRASRSEYWWFVTFTTVITIAALTFDIWSIFREIELYIMRGRPPQISFFPTDYFVTYCMIIFLVPRQTLLIRRLHDIDQSGICALLIFIPFIGSLILFIMTLLPSTPDNNYYGPPPQVPGSGGLHGSGNGNRQHDPMQGYAVLDRINEAPSPELTAARKAQVRVLYEQRVLGKEPPA